MFLKKIYTLATFVTVCFALQTCDPYSCNCPDSKGQYFDIGGVTADNYRKRAGSAADKLGAGQQAALSDYVLAVNYTIDFYSHQPYPKQKAPFSLISSAYACDCVDSGYLGSQERLQEFTVITLNDFDAQHLANDTINDLLTTIIYAKTYDFPVYLKTDTTAIKQRGYVLSLKKKPEISSDFKVKVVVKLRNGEEYTATTLPVTIQ